MIGYNDDEDFQAEHDSHILMEADKIKGNAERLTKARQHAQEKADRLAEQAAELRNEGGESDIDKGYTSLGKLDMNGDSDG